MVGIQNAYDPNGIKEMTICQAPNLEFFGRSESVIP